MKSLRSITRKREKAKARRKDFVRRKHINANVPTIVKEEKVEKYRSVHKDVVVEKKKGSWRKPIVKKVVYEDDGVTPMLRLAGEKIVRTKEKVYRNHRRGVPSLPARERYSLRHSSNRDIGMIEYPKRRKFRDPIPTSKTSIKKDNKLKNDLWKKQSLKSNL